MTPDQINHLVNRFLAWKLPDDFHPDNGISFGPIGNAGVEGYEYRRDPSGTNLLNATQAKAMVLHILEGLPQDHLQARIEALEAENARLRPVGSDWFAGEVDCDGEPLTTIPTHEYNRLVTDCEKFRDQVRDTCARAERVEDENARLREALEWYATQVSGCRKITAEGDAARHALDNDGGKHASAALKGTTDAE